MIRLFSLSLLFTAASWSAASACSPDTSMMAAAQDYSAITPGEASSRDLKTLSVGLIYVKKGRIKNKPVTLNYRTGETEKPFVQVKYKLVEDISGGFVLDEKEWLPEMDESTKNRELARKASSQDFAFWDRRNFSFPRVRGFDPDGPCGPSFSRTILPEQYYIQFKKGDETLGVEIVTDPDDPLVAEWKKIYSGAAQTKIARSQETYFTDMAGFQEIELETCPTADESRAMNSGFLLNMFGSQSFDAQYFEPTRVFRQYSAYNSEIENLKIIDLLVYQKRTNGYDWVCEAGSQYLVLDKVSYGRVPVYSTPPQHRYIAITNGQIDTKDILSNITILPGKNGSTKVSVEQVKSWIREANEE